MRSRFSYSLWAPGGERDPLSGIFLIPLGMPWTLFIGSAGKFDPFGGVSPAVLAMLAPAINLAILFSICCTVCTNLIDVVPIPALAAETLRATKSSL